MVRKFYDVSSSHITEGEMDRVIEGGIKQLTVTGSDPYGAWVCVPESETIAEIAADDAPNVAAVLRAAAANDCAYVRLDYDGPSIDGLDVFDW